jgi:hypothetical protein
MKTPVDQDRLPSLSRPTVCSRAWPGAKGGASPLAAQPDDEASQILDFPDILAAVSVVQYDKRAPARREAS